jgi:dTDP-4-dehydrorhamnose reductase
VLGGIQPDVVINTAAFHRVDECESRPMAAYLVNALGVRNVAEACKGLGATLVHFSTDYVFDGRQASPYTEGDVASPISSYGISKLAGENYLRYVLPQEHLLVRSSGLYGFAGASGKGGNFVETMLRLAREGRPLRIVDDQVCAPTSTYDLAETLLALIERGGRGTFHITNAGECSWYGFACEIFAMTGQSPLIEPISSQEYGAAARRPAYSVLANGRLAEMDLPQPRRWRDALADYLRLKGRLAA